MRFRDESPRETVAYWAFRSLERLGGALPEERGRRWYAAFGRLGYRSLRQDSARS